MPKGKGTYGSNVGRPRKKYQLGGGPVGEQNFPQENPVIAEANEMGQELQSISLQQLPTIAGIPSVNAMDRNVTTPMAEDEVGTGVYKEGGEVDDYNPVEHKRRRKWQDDKRRKKGGLE